MRYTRKILTLIFAMVLLMGVSAIAAQAQTRRHYRRPIIVRHYYNPFWSSSFYNPYYYDPYYYERQQRYYLESRVAGNERELQQHLRKYKADGVLTEKERRELEDDYNDVARSRSNLRRYYRNY